MELWVPANDHPHALAMLVLKSFPPQAMFGSPRVPQHLASPYPIAKFQGIAVVLAGMTDKLLILNPSIASLTDVSDWRRMNLVGYGG